MERARLLLGCYRKGDAEDPEIYVGAIAALFSTYPEEIIIQVTDPRTGIAGCSKFLPTISELRDFCEFAMRPRYEAQQREADLRRIQAQLEERRRIDEEQCRVNLARLDEVHGSYRRDKTRMDGDRHDRRNRWTPRPLNEIPPIGPEFAEDIKRLMGER